MTERFVMRAAIDALRATSGESHDADRTRQRIVGTVATRKRQRRQAIALVVFTFVGLPLGTTAYAAFFGTPVFVQQWIDRVIASAPEATPKPSKLSPQGAPGVAPPVLPAPIAPPTQVAPIPPRQLPIASSAAVTEDRGQLAPAGATHVKRPRSVGAVERHKRTIAHVAAPTPAPPADPSDGLYNRAHQLHFVARDPAAALAAWDAYLAQAPSTTLLPEAKYNRALCLVRLRREADAIEALTPFANGSFGNYRKREAAALLQALRR